MKAFLKILFILLMVLFWLPMLQQITGCFKELELKGAFVAPKEPRFVKDSIINLSFQKQTEDYLNYNFGFRPFTIKLKNTIDYLLYKKINVEDQVEGKDGLIFSKSSICLGLGIYYSGSERNKEIISKINDLKNNLNSKGVVLITLFSPSKELVYSEKIPSEYYSKISSHTDYLDFIRLYREYNIPHIDFASYFRKTRNNYDYKLFTKTGFHWSAYACYLAQDTLLKYMDHFKKGEILIPELLKMEKVRNVKYSEADFEDPMNLLINLNQEYYTYPVFKKPKKILKNKKPKVIIIGDSFFWQMNDLNQLGNVFSSDSKFWYYFRETSHSINGTPPKPMSELNIIEELHSADFVILSCSFGNTGMFPYGITDYYNKNSPERLKNIIREALLISKKEFETKNLLSNVDSIIKNQKKILLKAHNGKYVCSDGANYNILIADKESPSTWETFHLLEFGKNKVALYDYNNYFLSSELDNNCKLICNRNNIKEWESFELIYIEKNYVALKACNNKYVTVDEITGQLFAIADSVGEKEKFEIIFKP